jgi:uncharacterized protein
MRPFLALILAATAMPLAAQPVEPYPMPAPHVRGTVLDIVARGETRRTPDVANISAGVVSQAADAAGAIRDNAARMARVLAALKRAGIADRDVQTTNLALSPQYRYAQNEPPVITGYQASNNVTVRFRDISKAGAILDALVATGANQINGPDLMIDDPAAATDEARLDAMAKAKARAELYARAAGLRVKRILSISEASEIGRPIPIMMRADAAAPAPYAESKVMAGEQTVGVTLSVRYELEQ